MMIPAVGRIVHYRLSASDVGAIVHERGHDPKLHGNPVREGETVAMIIAKVWGDSVFACVNGQLLLDGNHTLWVTSRPQGEGIGQWYEPPRVG